MSGVQVWPSDASIWSGEGYKCKVTLVFAKRAVLEDSPSLFNASLEKHARCAINPRTADGIDEMAFKAVALAAMVPNVSSARAKTRRMVGNGELSSCG